MFTLHANVTANNTQVPNKYFSNQCYVKHMCRQSISFLGVSHILIFSLLSVI